MSSNPLAFISKCLPSQRKGIEVVFIAVALICASVVGETIGLPHRENVHLKIVDNLSPRYFIIYSDEGRVDFWNIDDETCSSIILSNTYFDVIDAYGDKLMVRPNVIPLSNDKFGVAHCASQKVGYRYSVVNSDPKIAPINFFTEEVYSHSEFVSVNGDICLLLANESEVCVRKCDDFSVVLRNKHILPPPPKSISISLFYTKFIH